MINKPHNPKFNPFYIKFIHINSSLQCFLRCQQILLLLRKLISFCWWTDCKIYQRIIRRLQFILLPILNSVVYPTFIMLYFSLRLTLIFCVWLNLFPPFFMLSLLINVYTEFYIASFIFFFYIFTGEHILVPGWTIFLSYIFLIFF